MELHEFLLARIAEDEAVVRGASSLHWTVTDPDVGTELAGRFGVIATGGIHPTAWPRDAVHIARWSPLRVLAECEAKRRIVEAHRWQEFDDDDGSVPYYTDCDDCRQSPPCRTLRLLALPYADHPDYRREWRP